jgi:putative endopeptidase
MSRRFSRKSVLAALALTLSTPTIVAAQSSPPLIPAPLKVVDIRWIDTTTSACTDFFQYANGAWLAHDTIPAAYSSSGVTRDMGDINELVVRSVLDGAANHRDTLPIGSTWRKLGTFYGSCMDSTAAETAGVTPLRPRLAAIAAITTRAGLLQRIALLQTEGLNLGFDYSPAVDPHDADHYIAWLSQGGLGLPARDYYTDIGAEADSTRQAYLDHIGRMFGLAGESSTAAARDASLVMGLETELAIASMTRLEERDPAATDHPTTLAELRTLAPQVPWPAYFRAVGLTVELNRVNLAAPAFVHRVGELLETMPLAPWRAYLRYHLLSRYAGWLSTPFVQEDFAFNSRFSGAKQLLPRWKRCLRVTDGAMGEALGEAYVVRTFPPSARDRSRAVIHDIREAFGERIRQLTWMSDSTKAHALAKLAAMSEKIGYPDQWRDYGKLASAEGPFVANLAAARRFEWQRTVNRPGKPVDRTEWDITMPTVNAYYDPSKNEMVFPAGALVPQTFDPGADDGANYGALGGSWAGHELTHGFDDEGRHYDQAGNLRDWWIPADSVHFTEQANLIVQQFNGFIQVDTFHVNGPLTLGENLADFGGVLTGYDALERALERNGRPGLIDGYTPEQRYFIGYAQTWRTHTRDARLRSMLPTNPHAPDRWRANGPLQNTPAFAKAFGCKPGDAMVRPPELIPQIW